MRSRPWHSWQVPCSADKVRMPGQKRTAAALFIAQVEGQSSFPRSTVLKRAIWIRKPGHMVFLHMHIHCWMREKVGVDVESRERRRKCDFTVDADSVRQQCTAFSDGQQAAEQVAQSQVLLQASKSAWRSNRQHFTAPRCSWRAFRAPTAAAQLRAVCNFKSTAR